MSARPRSFTGPVHGRTHRSAPTRWGRRSGTNGNRRDTTPFLVKGGAGWCVRRRGVVTPPYGCATGDAKQRADVPKAWLPPAKFRSEIWGVSHGHRPLRLAGGRGTARRVVVPYGWLRRARDCPGERRTAERLRQRSRGNRRETEQKSPPKGASTPDNPSVTAAPCQLPLHKGAFTLLRYLHNPSNYATISKISWYRKGFFVWVS